MKIEDLEAFVAVVRAQSISGAADALGLTQPTITRRVQSLEEDLGVELLDRVVKPPKPNAMGRLVHGQCRAVLDQIDALRALVAADTRPAGRLRLGLTQGLGDLVLPTALARLRGDAGELQVQVSTGWAAQVVDRLAHDELDGAVVLLPSTQGPPKDVEGQVLGSVALVVVGPSDDEALSRPGRARPKLADCAARGWVLNPDGCGFRAGLQRALAERGLAMDVRLETFGRELQLQLVADGQGLGLVPEPLLAASQWRGRLRAIPLADFQPRLDLWRLQARQLGKYTAPLETFGECVAAALGLRPAAPAARRRAAA